MKRLETFYPTHALMAQLKLVPPPFRAFPYRKWGPVLRALCDEYRANLPSPHIYLADFLEEEVARAVARAFPLPAAPGWTYTQQQNENQLGATACSLFPGILRKVVDELNSCEFVEWLSDLSGIRDLVSDPALDGGVLQQASRNSFLNLHADLAVHRHQKNWRRRVNLIVYLTPNWRDEWGGALEFWNSVSRMRVARYPSLFNHAVIFNTDDRVLHGFPSPLQCPENTARNSLALYYYTMEDKPRLVVRAMDVAARPPVGRTKTALEWAHNGARTLYCGVKKRLGLSGRWVGRILRSMGMN